MAILFYLFTIIFLLLFPDNTSASAREAIDIWGTSIVPSLFPYMFFSRMLCRSLTNLRLPVVPVIAILGMLGGSPSGAAILVSHRNLLCEKAFYPLCSLIGTISPMFILGPLRIWTNNLPLCYRLLACHWASALTCGLIVWLLWKKQECKLSSVAPQYTAEESSDVILQCIHAIVQVGGCVICYSVLATMLGSLAQSIPSIEPLIHASLEISGGLHAIIQSNCFSAAAKPVLLSTLMGFGGFSILAQNHAILKPLGIRMRLLLCFSLLRSALSAAYMAIANSLFPLS